MVGLRPLVARVRCFLSDALFLLLDRLMLPAEAPRAYNVAVPARMVLWQHVDDLRPLGGSNKENTGFITVKHLLGKKDPQPLWSH